MMMIQIIALLALGWCLVFCAIHFFHLIKLGKVNDLSQKSGNVTTAVIYSNTAAMLPNKKESAYKHLPTFTAGVIFHLGSFLSLLLFVAFFFKIIVAFLVAFPWLPLLMGIMLLFSTSCGIFLFIKKFLSKELRLISHIDDYFSEGIVTLFQLFSCALLILFGILGGIDSLWFSADDFLWLSQGFIDYLHYGYYIIAIVLFLYFPFGKLKHAIYYFAARYHLGFFYGWRNAWPPRKVKR